MNSWLMHGRKKCGITMYYVQTLLLSAAIVHSLRRLQVCCAHVHSHTIIALGATTNKTSHSRCCTGAENNQLHALRQVTDNRDWCELSSCYWFWCCDLARPLPGECAWPETRAARIVLSHACTTGSATQHRSMPAYAVSRVAVR